MPRARTKPAENADGDELDSLFVKEPRSKKSKLSRLEEYDEDPGRAGSQKYQRFASMFENCTAKEASKSRVYLEDFCNQVRKRYFELQAFRRGKEQELAEGQEKAVAKFGKLWQQLSSGQARQLGVHRKEDHPLFKQARLNLEIYQSLMKQCKFVEEQLNATNLELPTAKWKQDKEEIREFLTCSNGYGEALIGRVLAPKSTTNSVIDQPNRSEKDRFVKQLFKDGEKVLEGETWGQVAEEQLEHFSAMARTVQMEVQE